MAKARKHQPSSMRVGTMSKTGKKGRFTFDVVEEEKIEENDKDEKEDQDSAK